MVRALDDASRDVRTSALRLAERWLSNPDSPVAAAVLKRLDDTDWNVRRQLAATLGEMRQADKNTAIATLLERHGDDPVTVDAAVSSVAGSETEILDRLLMASAASPQRTSAIAMLAASVLTGGREPAIQRLFNLMAEDTRAAWQRSALMLGAEVAVLGAPAPGGTPPARGRGAGAAAAAEPCPTCPGARGGPGGASPFNPNRGANLANPRPQGPAITLAREPALAQLAQRTGDVLGQRAAKVLARVAWAGKPGAPAAARRRSTPSISSGSRRERPSTWRGARDAIRRMDVASRASGRPSRVRPRCSARWLGLRASCCTVRKALPASCLRRAPR